MTGTNFMHLLVDHEISFITTGQSFHRMLIEDHT